MDKVLAIVFVYVFSLLEISAQITTNSPYSRFGIGELQHNVFAEFNSFGGASTAFGLSNSVNPNNPATYTFFGANSFLLSTGGWYKNTTMYNTTDQQVTNNNGFSHLTLGFPLTKSIGASVGMLPFSSIGYEMSTDIVDAENPSHTASANYYGDGGISKIYFGAAYKLSDDLSLGANASFLFGGLNRRKQLVYDDLSFLNSRSNSKIHLKGYYYEFGLLYDKELESNDVLSIGVTANNNSTIRASKTELIESFEFAGFLEVPKDTFVNSESWGDITLPRYFSAGLSYNSQEKLIFSLEYSLQDWAEYSMFNESDNLANSMKICGGIQYTPDKKSITNYYKRVNYRLGASYSNTPLQFGDDQLKELSVTFGFGIPVRKSRTRYDISCSLGQRGTTDNNLIKEEFIRLALSVSYDGIWFVKRKYD